MKKIFLLSVFVVLSALGQYKIMSPLYLTKSRSDTVTARILADAISAARNYRFPNASGWIMLDGDTTLVRSYSDALYWKKSSLDTANRWAPKGTYLFPSDTMLFRSFSDSFYVTKGTT